MTTLLNLSFVLGKNHKNGRPQWQAYSHDRKVMYVPNKNGLSPSQGHVHWTATENFVLYKDEGGRKIVVVDLKDEVRRPGTSDRALRRRGIDPAKFRAEQAATAARAATGITPKNGVVQISARSLARAARQR